MQVEGIAGVARKTEQSLKGVQQQQATAHSSGFPPIACQSCGTHTARMNHGGSKRSRAPIESATAQDLVQPLTGPLAIIPGPLVALGRLVLPLGLRKWLGYPRLAFPLPVAVNRRVDHWAAIRVLDGMRARSNDAAEVRWLGRRVSQYPLDAWVMQEFLFSVQPKVIMETGTLRGGSALFLASLCDIRGVGQIISVDIAAQETPLHPRVTYLPGSSTDPAIVARVHGLIGDLEPVWVILDSDHRAAHVSAELEAYAPLLPVNSWFLVQDGSIDELPIQRWGRPGPKAAAQAFLRRHAPAFRRGWEWEDRYLVTAHPCGWLQRTGPG